MPMSGTAGKTAVVSGNCFLVNRRAKPGWRDSSYSKDEDGESRIYASSRRKASQHQRKSLYKLALKKYEP